MMLLLGFMLAWPLTSSAQENPVAGSWEGTLMIPQGQLRLVFHIETLSTGMLKSTMDSPDQGAMGIATSNTKFADNELTISAASIAGTYKGTLAEDGKSIDGTWSQGGNSFPLVLKPHVPEAKEPPDANFGDVLGAWEGSINTGAAQLPLVIRVTGDASGLSGSMDSPSQGAMGIGATNVKFNANKLSLSIPSAGGTFEGTLQDDGSIDGTWKQAGMSFPLKLSKTSSPTGMNRPQHPEAPFPYRTEDVTFVNPAGGHTLAGTLTLPEGEGPFAAAILVSGSGPQDRDETLMGHKPFLVIADHLTREGIAVLRYDDRGVGESTGDFGSATSADLSMDAEAAVAFLGQHDEIRPDRIGIIGHSEGGLIAPMVDARSDDVAFTVLLAGPGLPGRDILVMQQALILEANGMAPADVARISAFQEALFDKADEVADAPDAMEQLAAFFLEGISTFEPALHQTMGYQEGAEMAAVSPLLSPWFRYFMEYDPRPTLAKADAPLLSLLGSNDLQVPAEANDAAIKKALDDAGHSNYSAQILPELNHLFQTSATGSPTEYGLIEETFAPAALEIMANWINELE